MLKLISSEGKSFEIPEKAIQLFPKIAQVINENKEASLPEVSPNVFPLVVQWALKHLDDPLDQTSQMTQIHFDIWDVHFFEKQNPCDLMDLVLV